MDTMQCFDPNEQSDQPIKAIIKSGLLLTAIFSGLVFLVSLYTLSKETE